MSGETAFTVAVSEGHKKSILVLLDHGAGSGESDEVWHKARTLFDLSLEGSRRGTTASSRLG